MSGSQHSSDTASDRGRSAPQPAEAKNKLGPEADFYVPATSAPSRPHRVLKRNDTFVVLDSHGDIGASRDGGDGLFHCDTRFLSRLDLLVNGKEPLQLGVEIKDDDLNLYVDLTNPDIYANEKLVLAKDTVHLDRTIYLAHGVLRQRVSAENFGRQPIGLTLVFHFGSDFADIFEVRGIKRDRRGHLKEEVRKDCVLFTYEGLDGKERQTALAFEPKPDTLDSHHASYALDLPPGETRTFFLCVSCKGAAGLPPHPFYHGLARERRKRAAVVGDIATVETTDEATNRVLRRALADLYMLTTDTSTGLYPYAGTPWFSTTFGRDGLITAIEMLWFDPAVARGVLSRLAHYQASKIDPEADAEPGKILHEMRQGEMANLGEVPFGLYYGSVDSTPLFVMLAGLYARRTGDWDTIRKLWPHIERALAWIDDYGDPDGDSFVEYARQSKNGLTNQGWKDSQDAIFHDDGSLAKGPIALVEVQGYVYLAKRLAAGMAQKLGHEKQARRLKAEAAKLKARFEDAFWCEDLGTYALALDGDKKPCRVATSNAGQVLFSGIARPDRARRVAETLFKPESNCGWGIRTVGSKAARYNPMSYHNGSVWPHDNALVGWGFSRYGLSALLPPLFDGLVNAATYMDHDRLPELFCGFRRRPRRRRGPTLYPVACLPQAWAAGAPFLFIHSMLGLGFDAERKRILLRDPVLPDGLDSLTVKNLALGDARADFSVTRGKSGKLAVRVLKSTGDVRVARESRRS